MESGECKWGAVSGECRVKNGEGRVESGEWGVESGDLGVGRGKRAEGSKELEVRS